jgi:hypothetical protein
VQAHYTAHPGKMLSSPTGKLGGSICIFSCKRANFPNFCVFPQEPLHSVGPVLPQKSFRSSAYAQHFHYTPFSPKKQLLSAILAEKYLKYFFHFILKST